MKENIVIFPIMTREVFVSRCNCGRESSRGGVVLGIEYNTKAIGILAEIRYCLHCMAYFTRPYTFEDTDTAKIFLKMFLDILGKSSRGDLEVVPMMHLAEEVKGILIKSVKVLVEARTSVPDAKPE